MSILKGRHILLGITAGIAAYKTASLVRLFIKAGAEVKVIMTPKAKEFVTPLRKTKTEPFGTIMSNSVYGPIYLLLHLQQPTP